MNTKLDADDVARIAQGVEQREAHWYTRAMKAADNPGFQDTCKHLSRWHLRGERFWDKKSQDLGSEAEHRKRPPREDSVLPNAAAMAGLTWLGPRPQAFARYHDWSHPETMLKAAAKRARDLMVFYEGLKGFTDSDQAVDTIDDVIGQEYRYLDYIEQLS
jgi:hypothetical protein